MKDLQFNNIQTLTTLLMYEKKEQISKWGVQNRTPEEWMLYLMEEVGELAEAISENKYRGASKYNVEKEATQVAALALTILEMARYSKMGVLE